MKNILIVDDNATNLKVLEILLKKMDCCVFDFISPCECVEWAENNINEFDLAIVDFQMPEMRGDELAAKLRALGCTIHILILTAHSALSVEMLNPEARITTIINKPISISDVRYALTRWSERGQTIDARRELRYESQEKEFQELFLYKNGFYSSITACCVNTSVNGKSFKLPETDTGFISSGDEVLLIDGQNYSVRWSRLINNIQFFGLSKII